MTPSDIVPREAPMTRKIADCRSMPSESGCTLTISREEDEVLLAATQHAVTAHGHSDDEALRDGIRAMLRDAPLDTRPGSFVQLIEFRTDRLDEFDAAVEAWRRDIGAERTAGWMVVSADRDRAGTYVEMVKFPSFEDAMKNSEHPATAEIATRMRKVTAGEPTFRNLDVVRAEMP